MRSTLVAGFTAALLTCALTSTAHADPVLAAVGDIACPPGFAQTSSTCHQDLTSSLVQTSSPTAVAELGDEQYDRGLMSEYQGAYDLTWGVAAVKSISHPVPGNHEYDASSSAAGYFSYFGSAAGPSAGYYSYELGGWHVIALNSNCADTGCANFDSHTSGGRVTTAEVQWLANDLSAHQGECTLAYWHHPLFSVGEVGPSPEVKPLWDALYSHGADVVLNGHDHVYERYAQQSPTGVADSDRGLREFISGEGGKNLPGFPSPLTRPTTLEATDPSPTSGAGHFSVLFLTLHPGGYDWELKATDNTVLDRSTTSSTCHEPQASPAALPATPTTQQQVSFSANAIDPSNLALTYSWNFGDSGSASNTASTATPTHTYATAGSKNVTLTVTNSKGVATTKSLALTVTDRPPTAQFSAPGNAPSGTSLTFDARSSSDPDGTIADPAGYQWDFGDGTSASGSTAQHSYGAAGTYPVTLTVTDNSASTSSVTHDVTVNPVPAPTISSPSDGSYNNSGAVTVVGTASPGSTVTLLDGTTSQGSTLADSSGNWSKALAAVPDGAHAYSAKAAIGSGASSPSSATVHVTVDTVPPNTSITSGPSAPTNQPGPSFGFTSSEAGSTFQCKLTGPGQAGTFSACTSPAQYSALTDGAYTFTAKATDQAGNTDPNPPSRSFTVDTVAPAAPSISSPGDGSFNNSGTVVLSGRAEPNSAVTVYDGSVSRGATTANGSGAWTKTLSSVADGSHSYTATATDAASNIGPASGVTRVTVDTVAPATSIMSGPSGPTNQPGPSFGFTSSEAGSTFQCKLTGPGQAGTFSACTSPMGYASLADGSYTFCVRSTDPAGNADPNPPTRGFTVDTRSPPAPSITSPADRSSTNVGNITLTGTAEASSTVTVYDGSTATGTIAADGSGNWTQALTGVSNGAHTFTATATDAANNTSAASSAVHVTVDTTPGNKTPVSTTPVSTTPVSTTPVSTTPVNPPPPSPSPPLTPPSLVGPRLSLRLLPERLGRLLAHGLGAILASNVAGPVRVRLDLVSTRRKGRNRRASTFLTRLAGATVWLAGAGRESRLRLKFDPSARRHLGRLRRVTLRVTATITDAAGSHATSVRRVELRR